MLKYHGGRVSEFIWGPRDEFIMCCSIDGGMFEWKNKEGKWTRNDQNDRILDVQTNLYSLAFNDKLDAIFLSGGENDKGWVIIEKYRGDKSGESKKFTPMQTKGIYTHMTFMRSYSNLAGFICGTNTGQIKIFSYYFDNIPQESIPCHNGGKKN